MSSRCWQYSRNQTNYRNHNTLIDDPEHDDVDGWSETMSPFDDVAAALAIESVTSSDLVATVYVHCTSSNEKYSSLQRRR